MDTTRCTRCGSPVTPGTSCEHDIKTVVIPSRPVTVSDSPLPEVGKTFGGYLILRRLGEGGMGSVFEAEQIESGRRVAIKVLGRTLDSDEDRKRFMREGRLAASINHPNSVYVFGTGEIAGTPVITMELVEGGTLQDRVDRKGPLPIAEAIDAVLQVIDGLEAAHTLGVLHRDIKPSNCFVDSDGTVKIGDFGLSIMTGVRVDTLVTKTGTFMGTPAYASPEQLRGTALDVRSDIYSVGMTLYYLLTGKCPFGGEDLVQMIATVLETPPASPAILRPDLPKPLTRAVLRCLAKAPADRFKSYEELRRALLPYASGGSDPATLGYRFVAGAIDFTVCALLATGLSILVPWKGTTPLVWFLYFALSEGLAGTTLGKRIRKLRVVRRDRSSVGLPRAALRAAIFVGAPNFLGLLPFAGPEYRAAAALSWIVVLGAFFVTVRRRNGYAAIHELASGTRVLLQSEHVARISALTPEEPVDVREDARKMGPYHILESLEKSDSQEILLGYDSRLQRRVWIRKTESPGEPKGRGRAGRLRWVNGRRLPQDCWDAFEAVSGEPLTRVLARPQPWSRVRCWILDLAEELRASLKEGSTPAELGLDRVWITRGGRAKLLEFAAPGAAPQPTIPGGAFENAKLFLRHVALDSLEGRATQAAESWRRDPAVPIPLHAREFVAWLKSAPSMEAVVETLTSQFFRHAEVSRGRRLLLIAGCVLFPLIFGASTAAFLAVMLGTMRANPDLQRLRLCLGKHRELSDGDPQKEALEVYVAGRFGELIRNEPPTPMPLSAEERERALGILHRKGRPTVEEVESASERLKPFLDQMPHELEVLNRGEVPFIAGLVTFWMVLLLAGALSMLAALVARGGLLLRLLGIVVVKKDGSVPSRFRVLLRSLLVWSPMLLSVFLFRLPGSPWTLFLPLGLMAAIGIASVFGRSLSDRIAGTSLVAR